MYLLAILHINNVSVHIGATIYYTHYTRIRGKNQEIKIYEFSSKGNARGGFSGVTRCVQVKIRQTVKWLRVLKNVLIIYTRRNF